MGKNKKRNIPSEEEYYCLADNSNEKRNPNRKSKRNEKELREDINEIIFQNGSTWIKEEDLLKECDEIGITPEQVNLLCGDGFLVKEEAHGSTYVSTKAMKEMEIEIAKLIYWHSKVKIINYYPVSKICKLVEEAEAKVGIKLANEQRLGVIKAVNSPLTVITGVPGAGKTTIVKIIAMVFEALGIAKKSCNLAPTGKASKRMEEALGRRAETVDANLLNGNFITEQLTIVDESSFLDTRNLYRLLRKATRSSHIIFLGDPFQLSSVGCGMILRDLIDSGMVKVQKLNKSFRISKDAINIQRNVQLIRDFKATKATYEKIRDEYGNMVTVIKDIAIAFKDGDDFRSYVDIPQKEIADKIYECYKKEVEVYGQENTCLLIPFRDMRKGVITSEGLNNRIEKDLFGDAGFHVGSYVMQLENQGDVMNGSLGRVTEITENNITVKFENTTKVYSYLSAKKYLALAYAMSVHKSQGSEYDCVILATLNEHKKMLTRNLIYTGITRAKKKVDFFYDKECINEALRKEASNIRITMLKERILTIQEEYANSKIKLLG